MKTKKQKYYPPESDEGYGEVNKVKLNEIILQELDPNAKYIMLISEANYELKPILPKGIDPRNFVIYVVDNVKTAIRFVKIPEKK